MATPRLPIPGQDDGTWGDILNSYLSAEHNADGSLKIRTDGTLAAVAKTGSYTDLTNRPTIPTVNDATTTSKGIVQLAGDLSGTAASPVVAKVNGVAITGTPANGQVLIATSTSAANWAPAPAAPVTNVDGQTGAVNLSGTYAPLNRVANLVNIESLGCIAGTDDTYAPANLAILQTAVNAGTPLYVPGYANKTFRISDTLNLAVSGQIIAGDVSGGIQQTNPANMSCLQMRYSAGSISGAVIYIPAGVNQAHIKDLCIDGNAYSGQLGTGRGIEIQTLSSREDAQIHLERVHVRRTRGDGIYLGFGRRGCIFYDVTANYCGGSGFNLRGSDLDAYRLTSANSGDAGLRINTTLLRIFGADVFKNLNGIYLESTANQVIIVGAGIDRNTAEGIYLQDGATGQIQFIAPDLHSNSYVTSGKAHVYVGAGVEADFVGPNFGLLDTDATNTPAYCFSIASGGKIVLAGESVALTSASSFVDNWGGIKRPLQPNIGNGPAALGSQAAVIMTGHPADSPGSGSSAVLISGQVALSYFTADESLTVSKLGCFVAGTAAASTTMAKFGLYRIEDSGDATIIGIATEATLSNAFSTINAPYELSLDSGATVQLVRGQRYAVGVIWIGTTAPAIQRVQVPPSVNNNFKGRRLSRYKSGLSSLPVGTGLGTTALSDADATWKSDTNTVNLLYVTTS